MKLRSAVLGCLVVLLVAEGAHGASFIVPTDSELIAKTSAIVSGVVEGSFVQEANGIIETVYEVRVDRAMKGALDSGELVRIVSPGGVIGERGLFVPGAAHFRQGERVLVFLNRDNGRWQTTDLTLGKFRFATSTGGERVLVRDHEDVVGWDHHGQVHREKVRREEGFLRFIRERVQGRSPAPDYEVDPKDITLTPAPPTRRFTSESASTFGSDAAVASEAAPFPAHTYTDWASGQPTRWPTMANGVTFRKVASQNIAGLADGGAGAIQSALSAWNNAPNSDINLIYGGTTSAGSANHDGNNVVEFNDPQNKISGSWTGAGTIGICFLSFANSHSFNNVTYWNITDADVVIQNGYSGTHAAFPAGLTHEIGHGIGWRHSNQDYASGGACNSSTQECTSAAIMNSVVNGNYGYTLQTWDRHAAEAVYPGTSSCTAPTVTSTAQRAVSGGRELSIITTGTAPQTFQWYVGTSGNTANPISGATGSWIIVNPNTTTSYWVRATNACGSANSPTITVTVTSSCVPPTINGPFTRAVSGGTEISVTTNGTTPQTFQWYRGASGNTSSPVNTATRSYLIANPSVTTAYWVRVTNACGFADSAAVTITVQCVPPSINGPFTRTVTGGTEISITTTGTTPQTFQWYRGASGNTTSPVNTATRSYLVANPSVTTAYWVRATNACGFANSAAVTIQGNSSASSISSQTASP